MQLLILKNKKIKKKYGSYIKYHIYELRMKIVCKYMKSRPALFLSLQIIKELTKTHCNLK